MPENADVILKQKSELEKNAQTIDTLAADLARLQLKNEEIMKQSEEKTARISALNNMVQALNKANDTIAHLKADNETLRQQFNKVKREKKNLKKKYTGWKKPLTLEEKKDIVRHYLSPYWTETQISTLFRKDWKIVRNWTNEDFEFALTLRMLSRKAYEHLRKSKVLPLPCFTTLKKHFQDFKIEEGLFDSVMGVLKIHAESLSPREKVACLAFDEVHVRSDISYNPTSDQVIGPFKEANTMMLKLMFKQLKIPIWYRFDTTLDKEELFKIITKVEDAGYHVKTVTCDQGPKNRGLATKLGIKIDFENPENSVTWFENPARPGSHIYWLYDVPHLLKSLRNNIQQYGVQFPSGALVTKEDVQGIQSKIAQSSIPTTSKLRKPEIYEVTGQDRQRVSYAAEYVSEEMADTIKALYPDDANMAELADFLRLSDQAFDTFNSSKEGTTGKTKERKCGYGKNLALQEDTLREFRQTVLGLRILNDANSKRLATGKDDKITRQPWQIGFAISCTSLLALYWDLKKEYKITFILTTSLNQDAVESLFSILRALGGADYRFGALSYVYRLRLVVLGAGRNLDIKTGNVKQSEANQASIVNSLRENLADLVPDVIETDEAEVSNDQAMIVADEVAKEGPSIPIVVFAIPEDEILDLADLDQEEVEEEESDSDEEDYDVTKTPKRKKLSTGSNKKKKMPLKFDTAEVFSPMDWIQKRNLTSGDVMKLESDVANWDKAFQTYHESASDGKFSALRTGGVNAGFVKIISEMNPNNHDLKILKRFAMDRLFQRILHMKRQMKEYQLENGQRKSTRAKKIVIDLGET